jgi:hypothetical protein
MMLGMTSRARAALIGALALLPLGLVVGCCLPAFMPPYDPWLDDPERQAAEFYQNAAWPMVIGAVMFLGAVLLLAYCFVDWRSQRRSRLGPRE